MCLKIFAMVFGKTKFLFKLMFNIIYHYKKDVLVIGFYYETIVVLLIIIGHYLHKP